MSAPLKAFIVRYWPAMRLRTLVFGLLLLVAALPGVGAIALRVYENALVRQTEAELTAQSAVLSATATALWPGRSDRDVRTPPIAEPPSIDLSTSLVLPPRPDGTAATRPPDADALRAARALAPVFAQTSQTMRASIQLIDAQGNVIAGQEQGRSYANLPEARAALNGRVATVLRRNGDYQPSYPVDWLSRAAGLMLSQARPVFVDGRVEAVLVVTHEPRALMSGLYEDRGKILFGIGAIFLLLILLSGILARAIVRPIERLSGATRNLAAGHGAVPDDPGLNVIEIRQLHEDFRAMAATIARRARYLRNMAAAVSHEFKTPLSGIRGAVELLADHGEQMDRAERERFLSNMSLDASRLSTLVGRLNELAEADLGMPETDVRTNIHAALQVVADGFRTDRFAIILADAPSPALVRVSERAIEAVAATLIENSRQAGATRIDIRFERSGPWLDVDLIDDGSGIAEADRGRIFEPFFTSKRANGGSGLGLAISRSLIEGYGGTITLRPSDQGAGFKLRLPAVIGDERAFGT